MIAGSRRRVVESASAMLIAGALAACGPNPLPSAPGPADRSSPTSVASAGGPGALALLVLVGTPGDMRLAWFADDSRTPVPLPERDVRWASGSAVRGLVITAGPSGRIFTTGPIAAGDRPPWREIVIDARVRRSLGQPLADAVADPTSDSVVALAADPASGLADGRVVILDRSGGTPRVVDLPGRWDGRAPAWLGPGRIAVSTRDRGDAIGLSIVDMASGGTQRWRAPIGAFAVSVDGRTIAYQDRGDGRIRAASVERTMSGGSTDPLSGGSTDPLPGDPRARVAAQVLLDGTGGRLAVAWLNDAGDTTAISIYERGATGWALVRAEPLPEGTTRAVLVSLGP